MFIDLAKFYTIGHRGAEVGAVENSLLAFELAIKLNLDFAELDIQTTKDGIPVVFHDDELSRKTPLKGQIIDYTWDQIQQIQITTSAGSDKIPRLENVFALVSSTSLNLILELKSPHGYGRILDLIRKFHLENRVIVDSFRLEYIEEFQKIAPELSYSWIIRSLSQNFSFFKYQKRKQYTKILQIIQVKKFIGASFHQTDLSMALISLFKSNGKAVFGWGVKNPNDYSRLITQGNNGFTAPDPRRLMEFYSKIKTG